MENNKFIDFKLSDEIIKALEGLKYQRPTKVQQLVIGRALTDVDLIVKSQTGSGKTAAFAIPICERIDWDESRPQGLILVPTRELAVQVREDISNIGRFKRIKVSAVFGKQPFSIQERELKQRTHIVVGTPGRVMDHIERGTLALGNIKYLVLDEADEMLNMGFIDQVEAIIKKLPSDRITMLFSATLPEDIERLCKKYMNNPENIEIETESITTDKINHSYYEIKEENKFELLRDVTVIENPDSCIIFCRTKEQVDNVFEGLSKLKYPCSRIHGGMLQEDRLRVMKEFKRGEFIYLVATDVAARGIDVENVTHIINYDIPLEKESYVHRIGRTGRIGKTGEAISFVTPYEGKFLSEIEEYIGFKISKLELPDRETVRELKPSFEEKINKKPEIKRDKAEVLNRGITKLYFNGGKKKKMRPGDFVGAITSIEGVTSEDIGIIDILDNVSYVDILNGKGDKVLHALKNSKIKGKELKVQRAKDKN